MAGSPHSAAQRSGSLQASDSNAIGPYVQGSTRRPSPAGDGPIVGRGYLGVWSRLGPGPARRLGPR
eukprot:1591290-Prymnesium_polylepis.1